MLTCSYCVHDIILSVISSQLEAQNKPCIKFSADQYHDIFNSRFHNQTTVLESLASSSGRWRATNGNCAGNKTGYSDVGWCNYRLPTAGKGLCSILMDH